MSISSIPPLSSHGSDQQNDLRMRKAAQDFESMAINQMLQPMFQSDADSTGMFDGGPGEKQFKPLLIEQIARQMEHAGGIGLTDVIERQMIAMQEQK